MHLEAVPYDDPRAVALVAELQAEYVERYGGPDSTPVDAAEFAPPAGVFLLAHDGDAVVGSVALRRHDAGTAELKRMFVRRPHRGRGLGRDLLALAETHAVSLGYARVILYTGTEQPEAVALYHSAGYLVVPNFGHHAGHADALSMAKALPDALFAHERLAPLYDAFDGDRTDLAAYRAAAARLGARHVLDVGCGTGSLAVLLAGDGLTVTAVDPAAESLRVARGRPQPPGIRWILGDVAALPAALGADLALMTGNVAQVFLTDEDWLRTLRGIHAALAPGGTLLFETRRPGRRAWEEWETTETLDLPGTGRVDRTLHVLRVELPLVTFRHGYLFHADGAVLTSDSTLRFRDLPELEATLAAAGYRLLDVAEAPDRPGREHVLEARALSG